MTSENSPDTVPEKGDSEGVNSSLLPHEMPKNWEEVEMSELITKIKTRVDPEKIEERNYVSLKHMGEGQPRILEKATTDGVSSQKYAFENGDILFGRLRPYFRKVAIAKFDGVCSTDIDVINPSERVDRNFLFYTLFRQDFIDMADKTSTGTRMPRADWSKLEEMRIALPPKKEQEIISEILHTLDEKIEVNFLIDQTMEEMAQSIFKSWFVDFDRYEEFKETEIGRIPKEFEVVEVAYLCSNIQNGGTPKRSNEEYWGGDIPWVKTGELDGRVITDTEEKITEKGLESNNCSIAEKNTVLVALYGASVGNTGLIKTPATFNQACCSLKARQDVGYGFLFQSLKNLKPKLEQLSRGSAQQNISQGIIKEQKIPLPPQEDLKEFKERVHPLYERMGVNINQARNLSETRNTLLPKLMSGEARVSDISLEDLGVSNGV